MVKDAPSRQPLFKRVKNKLQKSRGTENFLLNDLYLKIQPPDKVSCVIYKVRSEKNVSTKDYSSNNIKNRKKKISISQKG